LGQQPAGRASVSEATPPRPNGLGAPSKAVDPAQAETQPGTGSAGGVLGDYELLDELGKGGMGVVYRARQRSANRIVALKVIRSDRLDQLAALERQEWFERFRREAQLAASVEHDHLVTVYEVGQVDGQ